MSRAEVCPPLLYQSGAATWAGAQLSLKVVLPPRREHDFHFFLTMMLPPRREHDYHSLARTGEVKVMLPPRREHDFHFSRLLLRRALQKGPECYATAHFERLLLHKVRPKGPSGARFSLFIAVCSAKCSKRVPKAYDFHFLSTFAPQSDTKGSLRRTILTFCRLLLRKVLKKSR